MDPNQDRRRGHFHRGRRGPDRRGFDRRAPAQPQPAQGRDQIDVEQIMREIRTRIAQRQGVELSHHLIDDLAARRLEYILDPRALKPEFLDMLRRSVDETVEREEQRRPAEPVYVFEDTTLYDSHRTILRVIRKFLNPLLKLFFNPNPLIRALHLQAKLNVEAAERDAARDRRQAEWNALHYKIVQRLVTEVSRLSLEMQTLATRIESLGARVDFADRRVRAIEGTVHQIRPGGRPQETAPPVRAPEAAPTNEGAPEPAAAEGARRRRRRRRGRRGGATVAEGATAAAATATGPEPVGGEPEGAELESAEPEGVEPEDAEPEGVEPQDAEPQGTEPDAGEDLGAGALESAEEHRQPEATWTAEPVMPPEAPEPAARPLADEEPAPVPPPGANHDDDERRE